MGAWQARLTFMSFPARLTKSGFAGLRRASPFLFRQKGAKDHCAGHDGFAGIVPAELPLVLANRAPARTRTSLCSNIRALLARSTARRGVMQRRIDCFDGSHPGPSSMCFKTSSTMEFAQEARQMGALEHGEWTTAQSEGWLAGCGPVRRRAMDGPSANPGDRERTRSPWKGEGRGRGVAFLLVTSLWPRKEKLFHFYINRAIICLPWRQEVGGMARTAKGQQVVAKARQAIVAAKTVEQLRQAQAVVLPLDQGLSLEATAQSIGVSVGWASRLRNAFLRGEVVGVDDTPPRGGRHHAHFTLEQEAGVLKPFLERAGAGGILVVPEIKPALEAALGRSMALSTVYNLLHRHGWRKLAPDKRHPQSDEQAQRDWKKNSPKKSMPSAQRKPRERRSR
ncbi:MAG TPA: winged helix-turn-helix domain-containing protein [Rhodanobacteraceae bacterium]